jgi:UDP:flavonoid glycosyltransferase YjiC (YdhE family)
MAAAPVRTIAGVRVLAACSLGGAGHFNPLVPFLAAAAEGGHELVVVGPPVLRDLVEGAGYPFAPGAQPSRADIAALRAGLPAGLRAEPTVLGAREGFASLATRAMLPAMETVVDVYRPHLVLREPWEYSSAVVSYDRRVPMAQVAISAAAPEHASVEAAADALDGYRPALAGEITRSPYATRLPASLDPSPFPRTLRYHALPSRPEGQVAVPDRSGGPRRPLVYMTFGAVLSSMSVAQSVFRVALEAVEAVEAKVLLTVGRGFDPAALGPLPPNVLVEQWVDQAKIFGEAAMVVCHGGSGTVFGALAAGLPVVAVPLFADQFENAWLVAESGAGLSVEGGPDAGEAGGAGPPGGRERRPIGAGGAPRLAAAIGEVLGNPAYREAARRVAAEMAATPTAAQLLEALLAGAGTAGTFSEQP